MFDCSAKWTSEKCSKQIAINSEKKTTASGVRADFYGTEATAIFFKTKAENEFYTLEACSFNPELVDDRTYERFLATPIIPIE